MTIPALFFVHTVSVEKYLGKSGNGVDLFDAAVSRTGFLDDERQLILSATGDQIVSESTFFTWLPDVDMYALGSKVTFNGVTALVLKAKRRDSGPLGLPDHLEVSLS